MRVVAIDPGRDKCGVAAMDGSAVLEHAVVRTAQLVELVSDWTRRHRPDRILLGDRTGSREILRLFRAALPDLPLALVAETGTTLDARRRYFKDHPPQGWRRLVPLTLQIPPEAYDDYAAIVLVERYLSG